MHRQTGAILAGVVFAIAVVGFAYAVPRAIQTAANDFEAAQAAGTKSPDPDAEGPGANHGAAVSTAAHCRVKGRAHGELVRSIARDKDATVADAESACQAAIATYGTKAHGKPAKTGKPTSSG
ncbi:MAG: hypothetical protein M3345_06265 [Actinomycetota bacterium]|nr:hypothetical protein [Actinomycetota bacterium]